MESSGLAAHIKNPDSIGVRFDWNEYISGVVLLYFNIRLLDPKITFFLFETHLEKFIFVLFFLLESLLKNR